MTIEESIHGVQQILFETFAELGTQTGRVNDFSATSVNLDRFHAWEWISISRPINYRNFHKPWQNILMKFIPIPFYKSVTMEFFPKTELNPFWTPTDFFCSKAIIKMATDTNCSLPAPSGRAGPFIPVEVYNRKQSILIPKELLKFSPKENTPSAFVFDDPEEMLNVLQNMQASGQIGTISPQIESGLPYNNGNGRISPGEFIGISLNLYNDSNSPMGGVQVLANDWDQAKNGKPCNIFEDQWPSEHEGAADSSNESGHTPGECRYVTHQNGGEVNEKLHPVCWVQDIDDNATKWVGQKELMNRIGLEASHCLGGKTKTQDCFIRAVRGGNHSFFSKIDAKLTFAETLFSKENTPFNSSNLIFFEISPWIPPGTTFNCRLRPVFLIAMIVGATRTTTMMIILTTNTQGPNLFEL